MAPELVSEVMTLPAPGKVTVLDFWDTNCPPCLKAMPRWEALWNRVDRDNVVIVGVSMDRANETSSGIDAARSAIRNDQRLNVTFPMLHDGESLMLEEIYEVGAALPVTVVIGTDGKVVYDSRASSGDSVSDVERILESLGALQ